MDSLIHGRYKLLEQLRDKPDRQTWLAFDKEIEQKVVIKELRFDASFEWNTLKQFEREAKIPKNLDHPQIPKLIDFLELDDGKFNGFILIQTYIDAPSLTESIQAGRMFNASDIQQIAKSVLDIFSYLHSLHPSVIHRDIKPSNILLSDRSGNHVGQVYLVDFGSVQTPIAKGTDTFTIVGSYGYMAPEQFIGRAVPASDLYGLGATLIYLATGQHPADLMTESYNSDWRKHLSLSPHLADWVKKLTEPDLSRRFRSAEEAIEHLKKPSANLQQNTSETVSRLSAHNILLPGSTFPFLRIIGTAFLVVSSLSVIVFILYSLAIPQWNLLGCLLGGGLIIGDLIYRSLSSSFRNYHSLAWQRRGAALVKLKKYDEAIDRYDRAIKLQPNNSLIWRKRGFALQELKRYEEALVCFDRAIELDPDVSWVWGQRGFALLNLERYEEALVCFDRTIELDPDYSWAWGKRGYVLQGLKRYEEALDCFDRAIELTPNGSWV
ncbi:MAG: tetratricopeptide repeat protein, partial [Leptolyngbya sp. SIO1D8]|nr:tetratricopeptide repeat protein [Leptolyngbya sp. SIO1D8]